MLSGIFQLKGSIAYLEVLLEIPNIKLLTSLFNNNPQVVLDTQGVLKWSGSAQEFNGAWIGLNLFGFLEP